MNKKWDIWYLYGVYTIGDIDGDTVATGIHDEEVAKHIVDLHNKSLEG